MRRSALFLLACESCDGDQVEMEIIRDWTDYHAAYPACALTLGNFDGLHLGHQKLIQHLLRRGNELSLPTALISYEPQPQKNPKQRIYTQEEKIEQLSQSGLDTLFCIELSSDLKEMSAHQYLQEILLQKLKAGYIVIGYDHRFGKHRHGDFHYLQLAGEKYSFQAEQVDALMHGNEPISSSMIRNMILEGNLEEANLLLGAPYPLHGRVVSGNQIGSQLGYKTANLDVAPEKLIPANGVYYARCHIPEQGNKVHMAMVNIGKRPTFELNEQTIEAHLLGFDGDLYGKKIHLQLIQRIRDERKFENSEALIEQIRRDIRFAESLQRQDHS